MHRLFLALGLGLLCWSSNLQAQNQRGGPVKVRFRLFGWDGSSSDLHYWQNGKDADVNVNEDFRSVFYDYNGSSVLTLYRIGTSPDGKTVRIPAAQANLDGAGPWPLIFLFKATGTAGNYNTQVMADDLKSFPAGTFKFVNYTNAIVSGSLGTQEFRLAPMESRLLRGTPGPNLTTLFASVFTEFNGTRTPVYSNNWGFDPTLRTIVLVRQSSESLGGVAARRIAESTTFPPEKKH